MQNDEGKVVIVTRTPAQAQWQHFYSLAWQQKFQCQHWQYFGRMNVKLLFVVLLLFSLMSSGLPAKWRAVIYDSSLHCKRPKANRRTLRALWDAHLKSASSPFLGICTTTYYMSECVSVCVCVVSIVILVRVKRPAKAAKAAASMGELSLLLLAARRRR